MYATVPLYRLLELRDLTNLGFIPRWLREIMIVAWGVMVTSIAEFRITKPGRIMSGRH